MDVMFGRMLGDASYKLQGVSEHIPSGLFRISEISTVSPTATSRIFCCNLGSPKTHSLLEDVHGKIHHPNDSNPSNPNVRLQLHDAAEGQLLGG